MLMMIMYANETNETNEVSGMYVSAEEYNDVVEALEYVGIEYKSYVVEEKMYQIVWYDYIDEEWKDIWCGSEERDEWLARVKQAEVEYEVREYN